MKLLVLLVVLCTLSSISSEEPCSTKTPNCVPTAEHAEPGAQYKMIGLWIVGPKKGEPIYSLKELQQQRDLIAEMRRNGTLPPKQD